MALLATRRLALPLLAIVAALGCTWIVPTEPQRDVPSNVSLPRFEPVGVDFAHRWDRQTSHHLTGAAVLDVDADGREEIFVGGGAGQPDALLALRDGRLVDRIDGTGLSSAVATYGSCAVDLDDDGDVDLIARATMVSRCISIKAEASFSRNPFRSSCPRTRCPSRLPSPTSITTAMVIST